MAHRTHVPEFGNWDGGDNVPYTVYFDKARKGRGGKMINPNDPEENSDILSLDGSAQSEAPPAPPRVQDDTNGPRGHGTGPVRPTHERRPSNESDVKQFLADSPSRPANGSRHQVQGSRGPAGSASGDQTHRRAGRGSAGSEYSIEKSPIHPQARQSGRGSQSPSWEGRAPRDSSHGTPNRSRFGGASRGDEQLEKGSTVPKFGEWDENDPASADGYTHIFNKVREERQTGPKTGGYIESPYRPGGGKKASSNSSKICWCFPFGQK